MGAVRIGKSHSNSTNPYQYALLFMGGKWKMTLIHELGFEGSLRYNSTCKALGISKKMFSSVMADLIKLGIARRCVDASYTPPRVTYGLTATGRSLLPVLDDIYVWSVRTMAKRGVALDPDALVVHNDERYVNRLSDIIDSDAYRRPSIRGDHHV